MEFLRSSPRYFFFTGKGGVGKTSVACAAALSLARSGRRVLIVSTDPASNLDEVLGTPLGPNPKPVAGVPGLSGLNLDPAEAARAYRERIVAPYRGLLPEASLRSIEEQLSGACTVEIAAFDEFSKLLGDRAATADFDHVLFDTAPTGHTLRLLELPAAWSQYIDASPGGVSCLGPLSGLSAQRGLYESTHLALKDPSMTRLVLVSRPESAALAEAERARRELVELGLTELHFVLNGVFTAQDEKDPVARAWEAQGNHAIRSMPSELARLPRTELPLFPIAVVGLRNIDVLLGAPIPRAASVDVHASEVVSHFEEVANELAREGAGAVFTMGKGGVGKTTVAMRIARELARRGHAVHLTTTDPAAHSSELECLQRDGIRVSRIDPALETAAYADEVRRTASPDLDQAGRALLEEELRSPCTEEVAVFRAFARVVDDGARGFVVIDTAPTGHTLLLLDAAEAYHREVARSAGQIPEAVRRLLPRLRDPRFTKIVIVTLPEATPVHEAAALQSDLVRAGIQPFAWVVNQSLLPLQVTDSTLVARRAAESVFLEEVRALAQRVAVIPFAPLQLDTIAVSKTHFSNELSASHE